MTKNKKILISILALVLIVSIIVLVSQIVIYFSNGGIYDNQDENDKDNNSEEIITDNVQMDINLTNEIYSMKNPGLAFEVYWAIKRIRTDSYSSKIMYSILDNEYLDYYNLSEDNIGEKINSYKKVDFNIVNMKYAYYDSNYDSTYLCIAECDDGKIFLVRYSDEYGGYTLFLDDYIRDIGYDNFVENKVTKILDSNFKGSPYSLIETMVYSDDKILSNYQMFIESFGNLYNNLLDNDTKNRLSYEELNEIYNNSYSFFGSNFSKVNFSKKNNEHGLFTYTFFDVDGRQYVITEKSYFDIEINIK